MLAAPLLAAEDVDSAAALVAQVPVLARLPVVGRARLELLELLPVVADPGGEAVSAEALLDLLSRQSFLAAVARTTPQRTAPYELVPKSR